MEVVRWEVVHLEVVRCPWVAGIHLGVVHWEEAHCPLVVEVYPLEVVAVP